MAKPEASRASDLACTSCRLGRYHPLVATDYTIHTHICLVSLLKDPYPLVHRPDFVYALARSVSLIATDCPTYIDRPMCCFGMLMHSHTFLVTYVHASEYS